MASFCLLHGAWHDASCWAPVIAALEQRGHRAVAPDLPFDDPATTFQDRVRPAVEALDGARDPVVVVGHSMAAGIAPWVAGSRPGALLVHLCAGFGALRSGFPWPPSGPDGTTTWDPDVAVDALYPRLPRETARALARRLRPMAPAADGRPHGARPEVPVAFVYAADDELFDPETEHARARELLGVEAIEIPGGHFPMAEDPDGLAELLDRLAGEHVA